MRTEREGACLPQQLQGRQVRTTAAERGRGDFETRQNCTHGSRDHDNDVLLLYSGHTHMSIWAKMLLVRFQVVQGPMHPPRWQNRLMTDNHKERSNRWLQRALNRPSQESLPYDWRELAPFVHSLGFSRPQAGHESACFNLSNLSLHCACSFDDISCH